MRLGAKPASYNKHRGYINGDGLFEPELGFMGRASEFIFGEYETDFQRKVRHITESKEKKVNKKLGQSKGFPSILKNEEGFIWTGEIYMGMLSKMDIVYDTGSDWLVVEGSTCKNCDGNTYDIQPSLDAGDAVALADVSSERNYGSAQFVGREYSDTVCILFSACVENFEFFHIESQKGLSEPIDGIMGMARNNPFHIAPLNDSQAGPLYVEKLKENGIIDENMYSFYYTEAGSLSWVDLGSPDYDNVRDGSDVEVIPMIEEDFFYGQYCQGIAIGDTSVENTMVWGTQDTKSELDNTFYSIIDTGSTALMISSLYYEAYIQQIMARVPDVFWEYKNDLVYTDCAAEFPKLWFMFDQRWLEVDPKDYVQPTDDSEETCILFILPIDLAMNILGMPLLVDYYSIHDPIKGTIGIAPHSASNKANVSSGPIPPKE